MYFLFHFHLNKCIWYRLFIISICCQHQAFWRRSLEYAYFIYGFFILFVSFRCHEEVEASHWLLFVPVIPVMEQLARNALPSTQVLLGSKSDSCLRGVWSRNEPNEDVQGNGSNAPEALHSGSHLWSQNLRFSGPSSSFKECAKQPH